MITVPDLRRNLTNPQSTDHYGECVKEVRPGKTRRHATGRVFFSWDVARV